MEASFASQLRSYYSHHWATLKETWRRLWLAPISTLLTWLLVGVALALPSGLYLLLSNVDSLRDDWQGTAQITLYLTAQTSEKKGRALSSTLTENRAVQSANYISREQALQDFEAMSGIVGVTEGFDRNPLPASIAVELANVDDLPTVSKALQQEYEALLEVEEAQLDQQWLERLYQLLELGKRLGWALAALLAVAIILVIGNTIRLNIENRREEILIVKLAGGTNAYVQRPFLYFGLLFGLGGGLSCLLILLLVFLWLEPPLLALAAAYGSDFSLAGFSGLDAILLLLLSCLLGVLGAWMAVFRHLRQIEPK